MEISPAESRILKKVIRTWIESEYGNLAKLNYLKQNIDDSTWKFAKRLHSEIGKVVSLDFILETVIETILILYPEYDAEERKRQELEDAERKRKEALEAIEQRKQRELEAIRQREEEEERHRREDILRGDIDRIRVIVRDCVCEFLGEEPKEGIDDEILFDYRGHYESWELIEINTEIEVALETAIGTKIEFSDDLAVGLTINEISKSFSFYFKYGRYPQKSNLHSYVVEVSQLVCQLKIDAKTFKEALPSMLEGNYYGNPLVNRQEVNSVLVGFFMKHAPPWPGSMRTKSIEKLISATQVLIDNPHYSDDYGYDEIEPTKE
jgi:hypothetical protein